ncbi:MAG: hypothetical protein K0R50_3626 [Eubacterium sp.]|nr:hypothetical protein [Eubacterium sp.]
MKYLIEESLLLNACRRLYSTYEYSLTGRIMKTVLNLYHESLTNKLLQNYLIRSSSLKQSLTYRVLSVFFKVIDNIWDRLYRFMYRDIKNSILRGVFTGAANNPGSSTSLSIFILFYTCGYSITSIVLKGSYNSLRPSYIRTPACRNLQMESLP